MFPLPPLSIPVNQDVQEQQPQKKSRRDSFPVDWFFDDNAAPISQGRIDNLKSPRAKPIQDNDHPFRLSPCVEVYKNIVSPRKNQKEEG